MDRLSMIWLLFPPGAYVVFDGAVSFFYFAHIDRTFKNPLDQAVRVGRMIAGTIVIILGLLL